MKELFVRDSQEVEEDIYLVYGFFDPVGLIGPTGHKVIMSIIIIIVMVVSCNHKICKSLGSLNAKQGVCVCNNSSSLVVHFS